jgi:uncharacterized protein
MLESLQAFHLTPIQWFLAMLCAMLVGVSKAGLGTISILTLSIFAWIFGSKTSTGILLPMLIVADTLAVFYYKRHADWKILLHVAPWIVIGILVGVWIGKDLNPAVFKKLMASIILIVVIGLFWFEKRPLKNVSDSRLFSATMGLATGFTTMVGNQAGGFAVVYFMSLRLTKDNFIGTNAWLFLFINIFKLPFHIFSWHTVDAHSISINLALLPFILIGFYIGVYIVKRIEEARYRQVILWLTAGATLFVLL